MTVPTLLIRGDPGLPIDERQQRARIAAHPDLRVTQIHGGHHLHMEAQAPAIAALIDAFICDESAAQQPGARL